MSNITINELQLNLSKGSETGRPRWGPGLPNFETTLTSAFSINASSRFALVVFDVAIGPSLLTSQYPCISVVPEATYKVSLRAQKGFQKALQGSDTETRERVGGTE